MENQVQKAQTTEVAFPEEFLGGKTGFEGVDRDCVTIPFLKIAGGTTEEAKRGGVKFLPGLEMGNFFSPTSRKVFGDAIRLVVLKFYRTFVVYDGEGTDSKFIGTITPDQFKKIEPNTRRVKSYALDTNGHRYVDTRNFLVVNHDDLDGGPMLLAMSSTGIAPSKKWITLAENVKARKDGVAVRAPMWASIWKLTASMFENPQGSYYQVSTVEREGWIDPKLASAMKAAFDEVQELSVDTINVEEHERNVSAAESAVSGAFGPRGTPAADPQLEVF